jgi:uncharacterized protein
MELTASYRFKASRDHVWSVLMDTTVIAGCLPGCRELTPIGDNRYQADLVAGVAAVSGEFKAIVSIEDQQPPDAYTLAVDANGRPGFIKGRARVTLVSEDEGTRVDIAATADAGGLIARVGQRLMEGVARMTMDRFFACLGQRIDSAGAGEPAGQP